VKEPSPKQKAIRQEIAANNRRALQQYKRLAVKKVEIYPAFDDKMCPQCKAAAGVYPVDKVPSLPIQDCSNPKGCRCTYIPVVE
jgi:hypothetical protein